MSDRFATHEVLNQPPPFEGVNLYATDSALQAAVTREGGAFAGEALARLGADAGSIEAMERGRIANENPPRLRTHDRQGRRLDVVDYHPAYHAAMRASIGEGLHAAVWAHLASGEAAAAAANVVRGAAFYMAAQAETGHCCPVTMTNASVPVIATEPALARTWLPGILSNTYDPRLAAPSTKAGLTIGMGMTEKQGGTDVRANTTAASPVGRSGPGEDYLLTGHKWFMSAPMSDAFLVLAQAPGGLTCFLMPRVLEDGSINGLRLQRLKDKLGNRSNASSEVEFHRAHAWAIGPEGRGVATIIPMVQATRLDCALATSGLMRFALAHAIHHTSHRTVGGRRLGDTPLMMQVLADMALDVEAATALSFRLARAFDERADPRAAAYARLMTPVTKYWVCKMAPALVAEAMECLGGNGYVEEQSLARVYREVPVNAIWEGSGNVMALDVLRVLQREPESVSMVLEELIGLSAGDAHLAALVARIEGLLGEARFLDLRARALVESLAVLAAGAVLRHGAPDYVADAFIASRASGPARHTYGVGIDWADALRILARAAPVAAAASVAAAREVKTPG